MNTTLHRFHRYALSRFVWPFCLLIGVLVALGRQLTPDSLLSRLLAPLISAGTVGAAFLFIEKAIRDHLWRIAYPELDFAGTWNGGSQYNSQEVTNSKDMIPFEPFEKKHTIRFRQDCLHIAVDYDETEPYQGWNSTIATLFNDEGGRTGLRYAYEVTYRQGVQRDDRLPCMSRGLEEVCVVKPEKGKMPVRITGRFAHTVDGPEPRYTGTVAFERSVEQQSGTWSSRLLRIIVNTWLKPPA